MPFFDLPPSELVAYEPTRVEPADFDEFWRLTHAEAREAPLDVEIGASEVALPLVQADHVRFTGFGGQRVHALWIRPHASVAPEPPVVVQYLGYGDGTGSPLDWLALPAAGFATLVMDTRGQGARARRPGRTGDAAGSNNPHTEGFVTRGILDPDDYYYRRVSADAVRAVDVVAALGGVDAGRIAVAGTSQGGALALAAAAWAPGVRAAVVNVPFLCAPRRALEVTSAPPYAELLAFVRTRRADADRAFATLDYVDGVNHAARARVPALFSVALMDDVCPPSTVYAAYNHYAGAKEIEAYPWNQHEGGGTDQDERTVAWLHEALR